YALQGIAASLFGRKMSDGTLNGATPVDAWTVAIHARRARPRLKSQSSDYASLVKALCVLKCRARLCDSESLAFEVRTLIAMD
ncbi:hypothetical protein TSMEX_003608, partial [Taenia solium]